MFRDRQISRPLSQCQVDGCCLLRHDTTLSLGRVSSETGMPEVLNVWRASQLPNLIPLLLYCNLILPIFALFLNTSKVPRWFALCFANTPLVALDHNYNLRDSPLFWVALPSPHGSRPVVCCRQRSALANHSIPVPPINQRYNRLPWDCSTSSTTDKLTPKPSRINTTHTSTRPRIMALGLAPYR